jgi:hypothetical protein
VQLGLGERPRPFGHEHAEQLECLRRHVHFVAAAQQLSRLGIEDDVSQAKFHGPPSENPEIADCFAKTAARRVFILPTEAA